MLRQIMKEGNTKTTAKGGLVQRFADLRWRGFSP